MNIILMINPIMRIPRDQILKPALPDNAAIKVIGLGGTGSILWRYLMVFLAALGKPVRVYAIDGDEFEPKNSERMLFSTFGNKAQVTVDEYKLRFKGSCVSLFAIPDYLKPDNIGKLIREGDYVFALVDNHKTRRLLSAHCSTLANCSLISAGNDGVEEEGGVKLRGTYASCQIFLRRDGKNITPPLTHLHPEIANPADQAPSDVHCTDLIIGAPQLLFANLAAASLALNAFFLLLSGGLFYNEVGVDITEALMRPIQILPDDEAGRSAARQPGPEKT